MAHQIEQYDDMFSVRETPWHGLGTVIQDYPTIEEAKVASGLWWKAALKPMKVPMTVEGIEVDIEVPDQFAILREDIHKVLGVVGNRYTIYQNHEMWSFIEEFQKQSKIKLETAGSLRNGRTTWVLAKNGTMETVKGDPIEEYFLFRNSFDGSTPITCMFTNVRVVCNNTLTAALNGANHLFNVRHTKQAGSQIREVEKALGVRMKYQAEFKEAMDVLAKHKMNAKALEDAIENTIFPLPQQTEQTVGANGTVEEAQEISQQALTARANRIEAVEYLLESGSGADIPGVKGTAYGLYNAVTEWADHEKQVRVGADRVEEEVKFENALFGTGSRFKADAFTGLMKLAA